MNTTITSALLAASSASINSSDDKFVCLFLAFVVVVLILSIKF